MKTGESFLLLALCGLVAAPTFAAPSALLAQTGTVNLAIYDPATREPMPVRIHLKDSDGKARRADPLPFWRDHFACTGYVRLDLPAGGYSFEVERGPEFAARSGQFIVALASSTNFALTLPRLVDLAAEGWWCGDLHVHRALTNAELLMRAEDLHIAQFISWWNKQNAWAQTPPPMHPIVQFDTNRFYNAMAGEDERDGGALLYFNLSRPLEIANAARRSPCSLVFAEQARQQPGAWIEMEKPFWWDFPLWLASGLCDSVEIANNHQCRAEMLDNEAWGRPRDPKRLPGPLGNGLWSQEIYYHALNCGLRIPPSAGSASGVLPNPVGYNRVYVQLGPKLNYQKWFEGLRAGRCFVSNGPLLRCQANGEWPGHVFTAGKGEEIAISLEATLTSRDPVKDIEIVRDGRVVRTVPVPAAQGKVSLGSLSFNESGWFLIRAICAEPKTFRFASTAPFYVEVGAAKRRISRASAQFFANWVSEGIARVQAQPQPDQDALLPAHRRAEEFWRDLAARANAD